ncbi:phage major capsid protein [Sphingobium agri]|uniref:Phage major capsid protein n=1 Tax=Sphingobium agri TaxID=2933566 RepID=A0ABT0E203_9SPHN|nr:phage major capsid protein [Sphingobium agri]MCK0533409.1 phage major capsid protein [Sphingobium agri]
MSKLAPALLAGTMTHALASRDSEIDQSLRRDMQIEVRAEAFDEEARTVELSFSSEEPYERWWGTEILDHADVAVRLGRLNNGGALLMDHNGRDQVGVVERAWISGRKGRAVVRFGRSARAQEVFQDVVDGIRKLVSVGYRIVEMVLAQRDGDNATYRVTDWEPYEISLVSIPADTTVGVGREGEAAPFDPRSLVKEEEDMTFGTRNAGGGAAAPAAAVVAAAGAAAAPANEQRSAVPAAPVDHTAAIASERERGATIRAMGARLNCRELADAAVADGRSVEQFVRDYEAQAGNAATIRTAETPVIGMSEREVRRYSFVRLMNAMANPQDAEAQRAAGFEMECSAAALSRGQASAKAGSLRIPLDVLRSDINGEHRDLSVGTATAGGHTVATDLLAGSFIDLLRNAMALTGLGVRILGDLNGNLAIPRQTGGATAYWVGEGAAPTESQQAFDQVALTPKTVAAFTDMSRQLLLQSSIDVEAFVRMDLAATLALALDLAGVSGSGSSNQPRGVLNTSGIGSVIGGTNGAAPSWDNIVGLETAVANVNAAMGSLGYLTNTKVRGKLKLTQKFSGTNGDPIWEKGNEMNGYNAAVSNQVSSTLTKGTASGVCSAIIFGNWADMLIGLWGGLDVLVNPYILSGTGSVRIEAFQSADIAVRHPESFAAMVDALTA